MGNRILLVEDSDDWRQLASEALHEAGFEVIAVSAASEAVLQKELADLRLIILDLDLGGENGLMLMKHLKRHHPTAPIVIYTGMEPDEQAIQRMREQGASVFLQKGPVSLLIEKVKQTVDQAQAG